jgi:hypothetical protein
MDAGEIWRNKADEEVLAAYQALSDYTDDGQRIVRAEFERRGLAVSDQAPAVAQPGDTARSADNPFSRLWNGDYPLPVTYWGWNWGGSIVWAVLLAGLGSVGGSFGAALALVVVIAFVVYYVVVAVGVWRSAGKYTGNPAWATLARAAVAAGVALTLIRILAVIVS